MRDEPQQELAALCWRGGSKGEKGGSCEPPGRDGMAGAKAGTPEGAAVLEQREPQRICQRHPSV